MKDLFDLIAGYPLWVKIATVLLAAAILLLLVVFRPAKSDEPVAAPPHKNPSEIEGVAAETVHARQPFDNSATKPQAADTPLLVGNVKAQADGSTFIDIATAGAVVTVPITLIIDVPRHEPRHYDYSILFDLTNTAATDLRIVDVFVRTISWKPLEQIVRYMPLAGIGDTRKLFCVIDNEPKQYRAVGFAPGTYLRLKPGELETVELMLNALHEGNYSVQVEVQYSVGGKTGTTVIGPIRNVRFLDRGRIGVLPR